MKKCLFILIAFAVLSARAETQYVDLSAPDKAVVDSMIAAAGEVVAMPCLYASQDQYGAPITVSGKIYFPKSGRAKQWVLEPHYTITSTKECPSECDMPEAVLRDKGYALVMPDYIGYGVTRATNHPYLHYSLAARNTLDLYLAAHAFLESLDLLPENDSLLLVGFSQGAQSALGTLQLLETEYPEIPVAYCYLGGGPYDVATTYDVSMAKNAAGLACTIPMLIMGTSWSYDLGLDPYYFMNRKTVRRAEKYIFSKDYTITSIVLLGRLGWSKKVSSYMTSEGMDKSLPETRTLYEGLLRSSIVHVSETDTILGDWTPRTPLYISHSTQDDVVPFENAQSLRLMLETKGVTDVEYDFGQYGGHLSSMLRFMDIIKQRL